MHVFFSNRICRNIQKPFFMKLQAVDISTKHACIFDLRLHLHNPSTHLHPLSNNTSLPLATPHLSAASEDTRATAAILTSTDIPPHDQQSRHCACQLIAAPAEEHVHYKEMRSMYYIRKCIERGLWFNVHIRVRLSLPYIYIYIYLYM